MKLEGRKERISKPISLAATEIQQLQNDIRHWNETHDESEKIISAFPLDDWKILLNRMLQQLVVPTEGARAI